MNSTLIKQWISNAMLALAVSTVAITVPTIADAKTRTVQVQDSYTFDEIFTLVKSKYPDAEKIGQMIKINVLPDIKVFLSLSKNGEVIELYSSWGKDDTFSLRKLNKINTSYNFGKVALDQDDDLIIQMEIAVNGVSQDYILKRIKAMGTYMMVVLPELNK